MGGRITYPDVDDGQITSIFKQSCHTPIHGYGYFVNPLEAYANVFPLDSEDRSMHSSANCIKFMNQMKEALQAAGLHRSHIAWHKTPDYLRARPLVIDEGWLVLLGTGFDKQLHVPLSDGLLERVKGIIGTTDEPIWWNLRTFSYPPPPLFFASRNREGAK